MTDYAIRPAWASELLREVHEDATVGERMVD